MRRGRAPLAGAAVAGLLALLAVGLHLGPGVPAPDVTGFAREAGLLA